MGDNLPVVDVAGVNGSIVGRSVESISLGGSSACAVLTDGLLKVSETIARSGRRISRLII